MRLERASKTTSGCDHRAAGGSARTSWLARRGLRRRALAVALLALAGCYNYVTDSFVSNGFSGDEYPIDVDTASGAIIIGIKPTGEIPRDTVLDVLSPLSLIDRGRNVSPTLTSKQITVLGADGPGGPLDLPRASFSDLEIFTLHPCATDDCAVGDPAKSTLHTFSALLGMSAFSSDALRLHLDPAAPHMFILPDIAGDENHRSVACDSVLPTPFRGGGTLLVGGTEISFTNWRIAIDTCLAFDPDPNVPQSARGTNVLLVASTGVGMSLLDQSAYQRYRNADTTGTVPDLAALPDSSVVLPSGPVVGKLAMIPKLALVGNSASNPRAPCRQVYASHVLGDVGCQYSTDTTACPCALASNDPQRADKCPCDEGAHFCGVPAVVELTPTQQIAFLVVPSDDPTLQALRAELRSDRPEVDGLLGADALTAIELDLDYPHDRLLGRCFGPGCAARPELSDTCELAQVQSCLGLPRNDAVIAQQCK